jgi:hypothetical protein
MQEWDDSWTSSGGKPFIVDNENPVYFLFLLLGYPSLSPRHDLANLPAKTNDVL